MQLIFVRLNQISGRRAHPPMGAKVKLHHLLLRYTTLYILTSTIRKQKHLLKPCTHLGNQKHVRTHFKAS